MLLALWSGGFVWFAEGLPASSPALDAAGDGVVVLTGGSQRISAALGLIGDGRGRRLLITGVGMTTDRQALQRITGERPELFDCCVDIDHRAVNTAGNARQASEWAKALNYRSLTVVTAGYHMPRSLFEFRRAMPDIEMIAYPVYPNQIRLGRWWSSISTLRVVISEYSKYLVSLGAARAGGALGGERST